mgnify:CR=1 FL=1
MRTAVVGGGAAGFFLAVNLKELCPEMEITIFERSQRVLAKVEISGGGRCNCTNSFTEVSDLSKIYPRGHHLLKRLFKTFGPQDAYAWFERHGVRLTVQDDQCVFPASQDSHTIINCFLHEARRHGVKIRTGCKIESLEELSDFDFIAITTGGVTRKAGFFATVPLVTPVPSLFTFSIGDEALRTLMGTVVEDATALIPGTSFRAAGPLLITHWGMSGPAILRLSSYAARELHEHHYQMPLAVNWTNHREPEILDELQSLIQHYPQRQLSTTHPFNLPSRLWIYLLGKTLGERASNRWANLSKKELNRLVNVLCNDQYQIAGRAAFKDEFVTCGGVSLSAVHPNTLECKTVPHLYFAGEVLDIDGVTGGFNFQAAWTTAYTVAVAISQQA